MNENIYERRFKTIRGDQDPISMDARIGENVTVGYNVIIDGGCKIGNNVFIGNNSMIRSGVEIGNDSIIGHLVMIESDTKIGEKVTIQSQCHITKSATIADRCFFGPMAMCINTRNISHGRNYEAILEGPNIKFGCRIGSGAIIMPGVTIGENVSIGAGAVVTRSIPDGEIWLGVPARFRGKIPKRELLPRYEQKN
jgi:acetyltransferase-like isoleucine patch superfamily enzyme